MRGDVAFCYLYGIERDDVAAYGDYRTQRVILEIYDELARSTRTGVPYRTRLSPPPADPGVCHEERGFTLDS